MTTSTRLAAVAGLLAFVGIIGAYAVWWPAGVALALLLGVTAVLVLHRRVDAAALFELEHARVTGADWFEEFDRPAV